MLCCPICLEEGAVALKKLVCGHEFCRDCMTAWSGVKYASGTPVTCPICRKVVAHHRPTLFQRLRRSMRQLPCGVKRTISIANLLLASCNLFMIGRFSHNETSRGILWVSSVFTVVMSSMLLGI
jgi:Zinc finger, C3HC4 type (RING finger)